MKGKSSTKPKKLKNETMKVKDRQPKRKPIYDRSTSNTSTLIDFKSN